MDHSLHYGATFPLKFTVAVAINPPVEWSRENDPTLRRSHVCLFNMAVPGSQTWWVSIQISTVQYNITVKC